LIHPTAINSYRVEYCEYFPTIATSSNINRTSHSTHPNIEAVKEFSSEWIKVDPILAVSNTFQANISKPRHAPLS